MKDLFTFSYEGDDGDCIHRVTHSITPIDDQLLTSDILKGAFLIFLRACTYSVDELFSEPADEQ